MARVSGLLATSVDLLHHSLDVEDSPDGVLLAWMSSSSVSEVSAGKMCVMA